MVKTQVKPKGRTTAYAFFVKTATEEFKRKFPHEPASFTEMSKQCSAKWKDLADDAKKPYLQMAANDKKRFDAEMKNYEPPPQDEKKGKGSKKRKEPKDPNAPKRSLSSFFLYCKDERDKLKKTNPTLSPTEVSKELGRRWKEVNPQIKKKYEDKAKLDKENYEKAKSAYSKRPKLDSPPSPNEDEDEGEEEEEEDDESSDE